MRYHCVIARLIAALVPILALATSASAQHEQHGASAGIAQSLVSGRVVCADGAPLPQAVVQAWHVEGAERHPYAGVLTDEAGRFAFRAAPGAYVVRVSYIGHAAIESTISIASAPTSLGDVRLDIAAIEMEGLTVAAGREPVRLRSGSTVVDAREGTSAGGNVVDVLRTVPGVEIDPEGRVTLRGSSGVLVLIDGRPIALEGDALVAFLRQMPASALERVEVGTAASAAQDAEGSAGVLNLVFRDDRAAGETRAVAASVAMDDHYSATAMLGGAAGGSTTWDASYSFSSMRPRTEAHTARATTAADATTTLLDQHSDARARHRLHSVAAGLGARLAPSLSAAARASVERMEGSFRNRTVFDETPDGGTTTSTTTLSRLDHTIPSASASASLDWAPSDRVTLRADARAGGADEDFRGDYHDAAGVALLGRDMDAAQREYGLRTDASVRAGGVHLEFGQAQTARTIDATYASTAAETDDASFRYRHLISAGYASARIQRGGLVLESGVRVERDATTIDHAGRGERIDWRAFPSLQAWWTPREAGRMRYRASLARRIDRPDFAALNPYGMGEDDMNSIVGNPGLRPEVTDQVELGIEYHGARSVVQLTPFARLTRDPIRPLKFVTESGHATTTLHNLERARSVGLDGSARLGLLDGATLTLSGTLAHIETDGLVYANAGLALTTRGQLDIDVGERGTLQLYAYRRGVQAIEQGEILPTTTTELAFTQRFGAEEQGRFTIRLSDPFESNELAFRVAEPGFDQHTRRRVTSPLLSAFFSWSLGDEERSRPEPAATIF
ncbi:MAG TPA: TonB-dependent receptor [Longimicrobiales bacterium]